MPKPMCNKELLSASRISINETAALAIFLNFAFIVSGAIFLFENWFHQKFANVN